MAGGKKSSRSRKGGSTVSSGARKRRYDQDNPKRKVDGRHKYSSIPGVLVDKKPEVKSVDIQQDGLILATLAPQFRLLNGIQEGSSFYNRIGRKIAMKSLHFTGYIHRGGGFGGEQGDFIRWMLIYDRQANGALPTAADLLTNYDQQGTTLSNALSGLNLNNADRFVVLRDKRIYTAQRQKVTLSAPTDTVYGAGFINYQNDWTINEFVDLKGLEVHYKSSTNPSDIGDIATGALYFVYGIVTTGGVDAYEAQINSRLRYWDL